MPTIYFDYNATTPLDPGVLEAMLPYLGEIFGNPSSVHHVGRRARALLDAARERMAIDDGFSYSEVRGAVWTEGTAQAALLMALMDQPRQAARRSRPATW